MQRLRAIREDPELLVKHVLHYEKNPVDFINDWMFTYDPRELEHGGDPFLPLVLYPRQKELVTWIVERLARGEVGIVEKSRDMGATWIFIAVVLWLWFFRPGFKAAFGSRKEHYVDKAGDPDSIFEKIRLCLLRMPRDLLPKGFHPDKDMTHLRIHNRSNDAVITGEAGDSIGRGGRNTIYIVDEAAFIERPDKVEAALSANARCRIKVSTPNGNGNPFAKQRHSGKFPVFTYHWRDDPRKDDAWYQLQEDTLDPVTLAQEVDIDYTASIEDLIIQGKWVKASVAMTKKLESTPWMHGRKHVVDDEGNKLNLLDRLTQEFQAHCGLDVGGGKAKSVWIPRYGPVMYAPVAWKEGDTTDTAHKAVELSKEEGASVLYFDTIGVGEGVAATLRRSKKFRNSIPVNVGDRPTTTTIWADGKSSRHKFTNLKAELWWIMRERLRKTYELWTGEEKHELDECLFLPGELGDLHSQLSWPMIVRTSSGKLGVEDKKSLARRGLPSPDFAEAASLSFTPPLPHPLGSGEGPGGMDGHY
mgnify:CR=1 FL=1